MYDSIYRNSTDQFLLPMNKDSLMQLLDTSNSDLKQRTKNTSEIIINFILK